MSLFPASWTRRSGSHAAGLAVPLGAALYITIFVLGLAWTVSLWLRSPGVPVQDEIGHVLLSRWAWQQPELILDLWGRSVNTLVYMLPALGSLPGARLASVGMACATVLLATGVAGRLGLRRLFLVPALLWFQPWFNDLAYTAITEVPFMLCLVLACWLWLHERLGWAALCFGLLPLIRHEGIALTGLWCGYLLLRRDWRGIGVALLPLALYNLLYFPVYGAWPFTIYLQPRPTTLYGSGGWLHFAEPLVRGVGLPVFGLALLGSALLLRRRRALVLAGFAVYLLVQTIIYRFGLYASGGYELFLLPLAPGFAIAASVALDWLVDQLRLSQRRTVLLGNVLLAAVLGWVVVTGTRSRPRPLDFEGVALQQAADWLQQHAIDPSRVVATHVWLYYFADLPPAQWLTVSAPGDLPVGTIVVWDSHYGDRAGLRMAELSDPAQGWRELQRFGEVAVIFEKTNRP